MIRLSRTKSQKEKLEAKYLKLLDEAYKLSKISRKASDLKQYEAEKIFEKIIALD